MTIEEIKTMLKGPDYDFLRTNPHLGKNIILLGLGGSYAYGTNVEGSDVDIRGVATNSKKNILTARDFEQCTNNVVDATIYSFDKIVKLLCSCNPNTIEMLGLKQDHYLYLSKSGKELLDNKQMFLSKAAVNSFGGYANAQLRRLENKASRTMTQSKQEEFILRSIISAKTDFKNKYSMNPDDILQLYVDKSNREGLDSEIFADINFSHYPVRDFVGMSNDMQNIIRSYEKLGHRNENAMTRGKLGKHMMHLVRLHYMCFDIMEKKEINTFRSDEHDLLMDIRNGKYLDAENHPTDDFYELVDELEKRMSYDKNNTDLPDKVDMEKVFEFVSSVNYGVIQRADGIPWDRAQMYEMITRSIL